MSGHKTASGHQNPPATPWPNPHPSLAVPQNRGRGPFPGVSAPSAALRVPAAARGGHRGGQRPLGAFRGGLGALGASCGTWEVSEHLGVLGHLGVLRVLGGSQRQLLKIQTPTLHPGVERHIFAFFLYFPCVFTGLGCLKQLGGSGMRGQVLVLSTSTPPAARDTHTSVPPSSTKASNCLAIIPLQS